jgi:hypothetical protein
MTPSHLGLLDQGLCANFFIYHRFSKMDYQIITYKMLRENKW